MSDFLIVGGGIIGLLTAHELLNAGASVTIIERNELAQESSWAGGGIVSPLYPWRYLDSISRLASYSQTVYPQLSDELLSATGINPEYTENGLLIFAENENIQAQQWADLHQRSIEFVDQAQYQEIEPQLKSTRQDGIWLSNIGQVRNPRLTKALIKKITQQGANIQTHTEMLNFISQDNKLKGIKTTKRNFFADTVIICGGAWSKSILQSLENTPAIRPVHGQMIMFQTKANTISRIVLEENRYIIPRRDGKVLFGSTIEEIGFKKHTTESAKTELFGIATEHFPILKEAKIILHWSGLRPGSPAGVPYICQHTAYENLYINAGHFRNGVVLAPASARLMADLVLKREPILDATPYGLTIGRG